MELRKCIWGELDTRDSRPRPGGSLNGGDEDGVKIVMTDREIDDVQDAGRVAKLASSASHSVQGIRAWETLSVGAIS